MSIEQHFQAAIDTHNVKTLRELLRAFTCPAALRPEAYALLVAPTHVEVKQDVSADEFAESLRPFFPDTVSQTTQRLGALLSSVAFPKTTLYDLSLPFLALDCDVAQTVALLSRVLSLFPLRNVFVEKVQLGVGFLFHILLQYHDPQLAQKLVELRVNLTSFVVTYVCFSFRFPFSIIVSISSTETIPMVHFISFEPFYSNRIAFWKQRTILTTSSRRCACRCATRWT